MISDRDFKLITAYEKVTSENRSEFIQEHSNELAETFLTMLSNVAKDDTIQYILCLIDELFLEDKTRVEIFHSYCSKRKESLLDHFSPLLLRSDEFIHNMVSEFIFSLNLISLYFLSIGCFINCKKFLLD